MKRSLEIEESRDTVSGRKVTEADDKKQIDDLDADKASLTIAKNEDDLEDDPDGDLDDFGKKKPRRDVGTAVHDTHEKDEGEKKTGESGDDTSPDEVVPDQQAAAAGDHDRAPLVVANELLQQQLQGSKGGDDIAMAMAARPNAGMQGLGGGNPLFGNAAAFREMQLAHLGAMGGMGGLQENPFLQQQLLMAGGNPFAAFGGQQALSAHQALSMASLLPEQQRRFASLQGNASGNSGGDGSQANSFAEQQAAALSFGFGGRGAFMPEMGGFGGLPALQHMMFAQRGGDAEALAQARRQMMLGVGMPGGGGFRPSFLGAGGGRGINTMSSELRGMNQQSPAVSLSLACDDEHLSEYQIMVRKQLEVFEAQPEDVESNTQGRKKQVALGQVGIRCKHCASLPLRQRGRGAVYYPAKLQGVYQAAQNMASSHLCESCQCIDDPLKMDLKTLRERRDTASGGKQYWADGARALGLYEADDGLRLNRENAQQNQGQTNNQAQPKG
jgi:hypothetical protein